MNSQNNKLHSRKNKELTTTAPMFIGVYDIVIHKDYRKIELPNKIISTKISVTHKIKFIGPTISASISAIKEYNCKTAAVFNIRGNTRLISQRHNTPILAFGPENQEELYYIITWVDVKFQDRRDDIISSNIVSLVEDSRVNYFLQQVMPERKKVIMATFNKQ